MFVSSLYYMLFKFHKSDLANHLCPPPRTALAGVILWKSFTGMRGACDVIMGDFWTHQWDSYSLCPVGYEGRGEDDQLC